MERKGKYIYGVLNSNEELFFGPHGISACEEVYNVSYQDISAVVSDSEILDYMHMRKDRLAAFLVRHQKAIEKIMSLGYTVIPARLGTFVQNETGVKDVLNRGYNLIKEIMEKIKDKIEIDVACTWNDFTSIIKEAGEEKEIKELKEKLLANPKGITSDEQLRIGFMLKKELDKKRDNYACQIQEVLKTVSLDFKIHELMDDKMVVNIAFLVDKDKREDFDKKVEKLNAKFNEKLNFRCVGPLPPYSFYTLEIKIVKNEDVDWAKKKLGILNDITSKDELKRAYQRQAFSTHPDKNPDNPYAEKEFDEVNRAHKILSDYCVALEQANPVRDEKSLNGTNQQDKIPFDREMFKENAMLVRVRE